MNRVSSMVVFFALSGCGNPSHVPDGPVPDGQVPADSGNPDTAKMTSPPPALGAQIARLGRPVIATMLIGVFASAADQQAQRNAYNQATDPSAWKTDLLQPNVTIEAELEANMAAFDAIDTPTGCGNALDYTTRQINPLSYRGGADVFADDQLYIDTSLPTCNIYLALEIEQGGMGRFAHMECGGRTLQHDAIDVTYSVLASGVVDGLDSADGFSPRIHGNLTAHADVTTAFPFLGPPHP